MVDPVRRFSEAFIVLAVVASPWAFGCVHPTFHYLLTICISATLLLWAWELAQQRQPMAWTRFQWPLLGLVLVVGIQLIPLGPLVSLLSPRTASLKAELFPTVPDILVNGEEFRSGTFSARDTLSFYPAKTFQRLLWIMQLALLFTRVQQLASTSFLRRLCYATLVNGTLMSYFAIVQRFSSDTGEIYWTFQSFGNAFGPFINRNHFAFYMNLCGGIGLGLLGWRYDQKRDSQQLSSVFRDPQSLWILAALAGMFGAIVVCSSRGGLGSLAIALSVTSGLLFLLRSRRSGGAFFIIGVAALIIAMLSQIWLGFDLLESRYTSTLDDRSEVWLPLLELVQKYPVLGTGLATLPYVEPMTKSASSWDYFLENAHNEYLQVAIEMGLVGFAFVGIFGWMICSKSIRLVRHSQKSTFLYAGLMLALTTIICHSFVEFGLELPAIAVLAAVILGCIAGLRPHAPQQKEPRSGYAAITAYANAIAIVAFVLLAGGQAKQQHMAESHRLAALRAQNRNDEKAQLLHVMSAVQASPYDVEIQLDACRMLSTDRRNAKSLVKVDMLRIQTGILTARDLCPLAAESHVLLAQNSGSFQRTDDRLAHFHRARLARPADTTLAYLSGIANLEAKNLKAAALQFRDSLALSQTHLASVLEMTFPEFQVEVWESDILPDVAVAVAAAADWLEEQTLGDDDQQRRLRNRAVELSTQNDPDTAEGFRFRATVQQELNDAESAIESYQKALRREPENVLWRFELAKLIWYERGDEAATKEQIKRILGFQPKHGQALELLTVVHAGQRARNN